MERFGWLRRYVSPVFLALLVASFILWYFAKLNYSYTTEQPFTVNVDGGPGIVSFVRNGVFLDGGEELQFGWRRFNPRLIRRFSPAPWQVGQQVRQLRVFDRALMTAECRCREYPAAQL